MKITKNNKTAIKYVLMSLSSFVIDISLFTIFLHFIHNIIISSYLARAISCFINYLLNKYIVFNYHKKEVKSLLQYILLVIINISISAFTVNYLANIIHIKATYIKALVDAILFICNFFIQKLFIFKNKEAN